jgi:ferredoxin-thioredoxin reductase catalytic chain
MNIHEDVLRENIATHARTGGYIVNSDKLDTIVRGLLKNQEKFGELYCPCRIRTGNEWEDRQIICPCATHHAEIDENGQCHCNLYVRGK